MTDISATSTSLRPASLDRYFEQKQHVRSHTMLDDFDDRSDVEFDDELESVTPVFTRKDSTEESKNYTYGKQNYNNFEEGMEIADTSEFAAYNDPILTLITNDHIDEDSLAVVLRTLPLSDKPLSKYITKALRVYKELQKLIDTLSNQYEFVALEKNILRAINPHNEDDIAGYAKSNTENFMNTLGEDIEYDSDEEMSSSSILDTELAKIVLDKTVELHQRLYDLNYNILKINEVLEDFSPLQYVSDAGVLLTNLTLKIIELKNISNEKINVTYSQSKLIIMGSDLDELLKDFNQNAGGDGDAASSIIDPDHPIISNDLAATIEGYKEFVMTLLDQLHEALENKDSDEISECLAVIGDLERMFDALMKNIYESDSRSNYGTDNDSYVEQGSYSYSSRKSTHSRQNSKRSFNGSYSGFKGPSSPQGENLADLNSSAFDNDTLYESDLESRKKGKTSSNFHSRNQSVGSSATLGMSRSASSNAFGFRNHHRTTIAEEMPHLLQAFDDAQEIERELKETVKSHHIKSSYSSGTLTSKKASSPVVDSFDENEESKYNDALEKSIQNTMERANPSLSHSLYGSSIIKPPPSFGYHTLPVSASNPLILKPDTSNASKTVSESKTKSKSSLSSSIFGTFGLFGKKATAETAVAKPNIVAPSMTASEAVSDLTGSPTTSYLSSSMVLNRHIPGTRNVSRKVSTSSSFNLDQDID